MILTRALTTFSHMPRLCALAMFCSVALLAAGPAAHAALINYGDFPVPPAGITFQQVTESSGTDPVPLYGPPVPFVVGLDFNPTSFVASATGGAADVTDGQLNFGIQGAPGVGINNLSLSEAGDYTLVGVGTPATQVLAGAIVRVTVTQLDGVNIAPISLAPSNASVGFNLVANPGIVQPWSLGTGINIAAGVPAGHVATHVDVVINNSLLALSQPGTIAFIAKKEFTIDINPGPSGGIPEPGTFVLTAICSMIGLLYRRTR